MEFKMDDKSIAIAELDRAKRQIRALKEQLQASEAQIEMLKQQLEEFGKTVKKKTTKKKTGTYADDFRD